MHKDLSVQLPGILRNEPMGRHTTFQIGGPVKYFYTARTTEDLIKAVSLGRKYKLPIFILGRGSNILVSDAGIDGFVIFVNTEEIKKNKNLITVDAGLLLSRLVSWIIDNNLAGLEFAAGIPGSVGGGIRGNAGAFGSELKDYIAFVDVLNPENKRVRFTQEECKFGYRDSIFKHTDNIILSATFILKPGNKAESQSLIKQYASHRISRQDYSIPSAGCVFKNIPNHSVGKLVEELGLKGTKKGGAMISDTHGNFIVNIGQAKARDVIELINLVRQKVKEKYNLDLETEIQLVGFSYPVIKA